MIDRSKFKSTSVATAKQKDQEIDSKMGKGGGDVTYLNIKTPGESHYRIYPPHPDDGGELYAVPRAFHWLKVEIQEKDDKGNVVKDAKGKDKTKLVNRTVFNARIHGGKSRDIIDEYIIFANKIAKDNFPGDENKIKEFLEPINGNQNKKIYGIQMNQTWAMYVDKLNDDGSKVFGRIDIGKAVKNSLNSIAAMESSSDPLGTDPFTDPEEGRAISVVYNKDAKVPADYYKVGLYAPLLKGSKGQITLFPLSDEDLSKFITFPSLKKMFINNYDSKEFDRAMNGLKIFDDEHELGVFSYDEFLDIAEKLSSEFPESGQTSSETEEESGDEFDKMDRDELKEFNRDNKLGIVPNKSMDDNAFRALIRESISSKVEVKKEVEEEPETEAEKNDGLPWKKDGTERVVEKELVSETKSISPDKKQSVQDRLNKLKSK
jgi:hypothetical protein